MHFFDWKWHLFGLRGHLLTEMSVLVTIRSLLVIEGTFLCPSPFLPPLTKGRGLAPFGPVFRRPCTQHHSRSRSNMISSHSSLALLRVGIHLLWIRIPYEKGAVCHNLYHIIIPAGRYMCHDFRPHLFGLRSSIRHDRCGKRRFHVYDYHRPFEIEMLYIYGLGYWVI